MISSLKPNAVRWDSARRALVLTTGLCVMLVSLSACNSTDDEEDVLSATSTTDNTSATDGTDGTGGTDGTNGTGVPTDGWPVCTPGEFKQCTPDYRGEVICNATGDGYESHACKDAAGTITLCHKDKPGCLDCVPGLKRCKDDTELEICGEDGTAWQDFQKCNSDVNGQVCTQSDKGAACVRLCELSLKWNTYMGCEYWAADLDNAFVPGGSRGYYDAAGSQYAIVVSNPNQKLTATVDIFDSDGKVTHDSAQIPFDTSPIPPGGLRVYNLPRRDVDTTVLAPLAYKVTATIPITAYQFNPLENVDVFSNDASLLLPENVLGKWYIVMTREQTFEILRSYVTVIAGNAGETEVTVTVTAPTLPANGIPHLEPGESITRTLTQYDVLNIETNKPGADLTGTVVLATNRVAVFGGSEAANAPNTASCDIAHDAEEGVCSWDGETPCESPLDCLDFNTCCADHLEHQMFPVKTWGKHYVAARTFPRGAERDVWRIMAADKNTKVTTIPPQATIPVLHSGEWFEFESAHDFEIVATKPILVGQFLAAQDAPEPNVNGIPQPGDAGIGDPAFILAVPFEQYRTDYVFLAPNKYELDYVTVTAPTGAEVTFDGELLDPADFEPIGTGQFSAARFLIDDGAHSISSNEKIGIIVYGYDQYVSYGYPGGLDLKDLGFLKETGQ